MPRGGDTGDVGERIQKVHYTRQTKSRHLLKYVTKKPIAMDVGATKATTEKIYVK